MRQHKIQQIMPESQKVKLLEGCPSGSLALRCARLLIPLPARLTLPISPLSRLFAR